MQKYLVPGAILIVLLGAAYYLLQNKNLFSTVPRSEPTTYNLQPTTNSSLTYGPFKGTLPCADCPGLETELTLTKNGPYEDEGNYILSENYIDKSPKPIVTKGKWTLIRGDATNINASVFQLDPDKPDQSTYYLKVSDAKLELLDKDLQKIDSPFPMILKK